MRFGSAEIGARGMVGAGLLSERGCGPMRGINRRGARAEACDPGEAADPSCISENVCVVIDIRNDGGGGFSAFVHYFISISGQPCLEETLERLVDLRQGQAALVPHIFD